MTHEELVEKVARGICKSDMGDKYPAHWDYSTRVRLTYCDLANAAIAAVAEALKEPTPDMFNIAPEYLDPDRVGYSQMHEAIWQAMLAASPLYPKEAAK